MKGESLKYRWVVWMIMAMSFLIVFFHRYNTAVVADNLTRDLGLTGLELSNLASMYFYSYALMQIPVGVMVDFIGPRKTTAYGLFLASLGTIMFGLSATVYVAYVGRLLVGIGVSSAFISTLKVQAIWFKPEEFSTISGLTALVGNIGALLATAPLAFLVLSLGWRNSFFVVGSVTLIMAIVVYFFVKDSPDELYNRNSKKGSKPDLLTLWDSLKRVVLNKWIWPNVFILLGVMGSAMSYSGLWGVPYLMDVYGFTKTTASGYIMTLTIGIIIGAPIIGFISDKFNTRKILMITGTIFYTLIWFLILFIWKGKPPVNLLIPLHFLLGFLSITFILTFTNAKEVNPPEFSGIATSFVNVYGFLGTSILNVGVGYLLGKCWDGTIINQVPAYSQGNYQKGFILYLLMSFISVLASFLIKERIKGKENKRRS